nr:PREDICTED: uncharacterized protein LOC107398782 isoform X1 [Tribolium castaneum]|eukprot:XP_015839637.1 PREDICTED: uncharacterized protein LOC107398782 isoform X1 [Tribolium castaneum]
MVFAMVMEKYTLEMVNLSESEFWPMDFAGKRMEAEIGRNYLMTRIVYYFLGGALLASMLILLPFFGDLNDWLLSSQMSVDYFGEWSVLVDLILFSTGPMVALSEIRAPAVFLYGIYKIDLQIFLLNKLIVQLSHEKARDDAKYQRRIFAKLRQFTKHHANLKKCMRGISDIMNLSMPVFVFIGAPGVISIMYYFLYSLDSASTITKIRSVYVAVFTSVIVATFAHAGQKISDNTSLIFDTLTTCPWNLWDKRNRKVLLIFMANSVKPMTFSVAGITVDYQFAIKVRYGSWGFVMFELFQMIKLSSSYALVLYQLKNQYNMN